jgi:hypothetical protein
MFFCKDNKLYNRKQFSIIGAFASSLKLPVAGYRRFIEGGLFRVDEWGYYWSSTVSSKQAILLFFDNTSASTPPNLRAYGYSVRCIKD